MLPTNAHYSVELPQAFVVGEDELKSLADLLSDRIGNLQIRADCADAKCAIADGKRLLVSSANFTAAALGKNMELGVLIEGGQVPAVVEGRWEGLVRQGTLRPFDRGDDRE